MDKERKLINLVSPLLPRSKNQINKLFQSDSEIVEEFGGFTLFNIDEFSNEDHFRENDGFSLGWNMAVGAISDIYATGGKPVYYLHSLTVDKNWEEEYITEIVKGVSKALEKSSVSFLGGDFGVSEQWRYTATVIGRSEKPVMRSGANPGDSVFMTGNIGRGNIEAFLKIYSDRSIISTISDILPLRLPLRTGESELIARYATSCIDTSDGVFNGIHTIAEMSDCGFYIEKLPFLNGASIISKVSGLSKLLLFFGEAGEYELLFTVPQNRVEQFLQEAKKYDINYLGKITTGSKELKYKEKAYNLENFSLRARDFEEVKDYISEVSKWLEKVK
jgi:thiamine-monophosphate kinase